MSPSPRGNARSPADSQPVVSLYHPFRFAYLFPLRREPAYLVEADGLAEPNIGDVVARSSLSWLGEEKITPRDYQCCLLAELAGDSEMVRYEHRQ